MKKKWFESIAFMSVFALLLFGVRFALANVGRTPHVYDYAETLNLEEKDEVMPEKQTELDDKEEEESETSQETPKPEEPDEPDEPMQEPPSENAPITSSSPEDSSQQEGASASEEGGNGTQEGEGTPGEGGEGEGEGPAVTPEPEVTLPPIPVPSETPEPSATPIVTEPPEKTLPPTQVPDEIVGITCEWPDRDKAQYGKAVPDESLKVYTVYRSGKKEELRKKDYFIIGLNTKLCGIRQFTVFYEDFEYTMDYTVNNYMVSLEYEWEEEINIFRKGEVINAEELNVYALMADGTDQDIRYGDYLLEGIDNLLLDVEQTFTITYEGFQASGTCIFTEQKWTSEMKYYTDADYTTLQGSEQSRLDPSDVVGAPSKLGSIVEWSGKRYRVVRQTLKIDGVVHPFGTDLNEKKHMKVQVTYECACMD